MAKRRAPRRPSVMRHQFSQAPQARIPRSSFDRSHGVKTTFDGGYLVPVFVDEVLPGDTFNLRMTAFGRLATPIKPLLDNLFLESFFFFIPNRLVWDNWQKFNGEQENPGDSTDYLVPILDDNIVTGLGMMSDYFGIPEGIYTGESAIEVNALPFRGFHLVWNEWFRDQNLQDSLVVHKGDGPDPFADYIELPRRGKRHDYFTSCLPWPQKGDPVTVDLGGDAPIYTTANAQGDPIWWNTDKDGADQISLQSDGSTNQVEHGGLTQTGDPNIFADLASATGFTINDLRQAFQIQKLLERDARGGTRYTEIVRSHFGVVSPDARLQRPEFLGGGTTMVNINPVPQTVPDDIGSEQTPLGNLGGFGTVQASGHGFTKSFTEHGFVLGFVSVRADLTYQQGLNRMWSRRSRFDYYWPALAHIGEQAVLNKEIYLQGGTDESDEDNQVFGYQERNAEYRYKPSIITGQMKSTNPASLDVWHLSQEFETLPVLGAEFIEDNPPIDRVIAVQDEPHFLLDCYFKLRCARPMPLYGVPGLIDHF